MDLNTIINESILPNELMFKILFKANGLMHPCATIINNHIKNIKNKNKSRRKSRSIISQLRFDKLYKEYNIELIRKYKIQLRK